MFFPSKYFLYRRIEEDISFLSATCLKAGGLNALDSDPLTYFSSLGPRAKKSKLLEVSVVFEWQTTGSWEFLGAKQRGRESIGRAAEPLVRGILTLLRRGECSNRGERLK